MYCKLINDTLKESARGKSLFSNPDSLEIVAIVEGSAFKEYLVKANWEKSLSPHKMNGELLYLDPAFKQKGERVKGGYWLREYEILVFSELLSNSQSKFLLEDSY